MINNSEPGIIERIPRELRRKGKWVDKTGDIQLTMVNNNKYANNLIVLHIEMKRKRKESLFASSSNFVCSARARERSRVRTRCSLRSCSCSWARKNSIIIILPLGMSQKSNNTECVRIYFECGNLVRPKLLNCCFCCWWCATSLNFQVFSLLYIDIQRNLSLQTLCFTCTCCARLVLSLMVDSWNYGLTQWVFALLD